MSTPLFDAIIEYALAQPTPFHMPGHKQGSFFTDEINSVFNQNHQLYQLSGWNNLELNKGKLSQYSVYEKLSMLPSLMCLDITEIPGLDNLHGAEGVIKEAQELGAKAFHADKSYMLVNGSTCGIHSLIMTTCKPGEKIIVQRNCHRAVFEGIALAGALPYYMMPKPNKEFGLMHPIDLETVKKALDHCPEAKAVFLTSPDYFGQCTNLKDISELVHSRGKLLLVDEAHGAQFVFSKELPDSAMELGADACVSSAHKTLPALTPGAWLHLKGEGVNRERLEEMLSVLQTTSPSYLVMAFLDVSRELMILEGEKRLKEVIKIAKYLREYINHLENIKIFEGEIQDPSRLVINVSGIGMTGFDADKFLWKNFRIQSEMADLNNIVFILTAADGAKSIDRLKEGLTSLIMTIDSEKNNGHQVNTVEGDVEIVVKTNGNFIDTYSLFTDKIPEKAKELDEVLQAEKVWCDLESASGKICGTMVVPYPPGIPLIMPGEKLDKKSLNYLKAIVAAGGTVNGLTSKGIRVVKNS